MSSSSDTEISGGEILQIAYENISLSAFDINGTLTGYIDETWDSKTIDPNKTSDTLVFKSDEKSKLTLKYTSTDTSANVTGNFKAIDGNAFRYSHSETYKETSKGSSGTSNISSTYQEGASTPDKEDDITLSITYLDKYSYNDQSDSTKGNEAGSISYADGNGVKYSVKFSDTYTDDTFFATVPNMSYSDLDGNKFQFSGSIDQDGVIKVTSLSVTMDGETLKLSKGTIDSGYTYQDLFPVGTDDSVDLPLDFNGAADGIGIVGDFMDNYAINWMDIIQSQ